MATRENQLGEFLRSSRGRLEPSAAGLPGDLTARRVTGLRREEVAVLSGVSADYYTRLEQGRERNPSAQVVTALARALRLTPDARDHLHRLAGLLPGLSDVAPTRVHPSLSQLVDAFPRAAAYVLGPAFDVLATNRIADGLLFPFGDERNMPRILFTHPAARTVFVEWPLVAGATVHALRLNAGRFPSDPGISALVAELSAASAEFRELWADHTVAGLTRAYKVFVHPGVGRVELTYQTFDVTDAPGQQLLVGTAESLASQDAIDRLAAMAHA
ncbi:helix-turn-helix transcriptional regulator [Kutzneria kofuensis]|uniref:Transcriptional regulator with XRE-family HTH domain n=1 Tax=Kutzneria kofuensis TaxID=103725 RepID=A0A7W9KRH5_9PSEU|nr:helix-turn-helix transcriptional regulator [Kutzneria kofuensis]MBB5897403.1 transcriptional regulator with XRE-family HTH domain [Kutzneria kofuensis]